MKITAAEKWEDEACLMGEEWRDQDAIRPADWHSTQKRRRFTVVTSCSVSEDLVHRGKVGIPLQRSAALLALAEDVVARPQVDDFSEQWIETLARDLARFTD